MNKKRVVVTGMGIISPIGNNITEFYVGLKNGICGIDKIKSFDTRNWKFQTGAEIKNFAPTNFFSKKELRRMDRASQITLVACDEAVKMSGIDFTKIDTTKVGVSLGTTLGGTILASKYYKKLKLKNKIYASCLLDYPLYSAGTRICIRYGILGPNVVISTACSSSNVAISYGFDLIRYGEMDVMIVGGFDTMCELTWAGFGVLRNVSPDICQPFDKNRKGLVLGEAAGILILEELTHAINRGAKIYAEVAGYGCSTDAYHMTAPDMTATGPAMAMTAALNDAGIEPSQIDYINAHGTGTVYNDLIETKAIKKVFGEYAKSVPVSSTKSQVGHTLGACGAVELITCCLAINHNFVPPTINYETPDPQCDLDYVPNKSREKKVNYALSNTFGFGGNNCSVIIKRFMEDREWNLQ